MNESEKDRLREKIATALTGLGDTPDRIAHNLLLTLGQFSCGYSPMHCPIATYIKTVVEDLMMDGDYVACTYTEYEVELESGRVSGVLPFAVTAFIRVFDNGGYSALCKYEVIALRRMGLL